MELFNQFQGLVFCFLYALFFSFVYSFFNRLFYKIRKSILRYLLEIFICGVAAILFFFLLVKINYGFLNFYMIICFVLGLFVYELIYARYVLAYYERIIKLIRYLFTPIHFIFRKINGIMLKYKKVMKKWKDKREIKRRNRKQEKSEKLLEVD
jgi:hypothetical protein